MLVYSSRARMVLLVVPLAAVTSAGLMILSSAIRRPTATLPVYGAVPDFSLVERSGRAVTRADLLGKVSVVNFFYTRCPDSCPLQSAHLARLQADLSGAPDLLLVSITVDPDHDDRNALASYAAGFRADPNRWLFLTGPWPDTYRLAVNGFHLAVIAARPSLLATALAWIWPAHRLGSRRRIEPEDHSPRPRFPIRARRPEGSNRGKLRRRRLERRRAIARCARPTAA